MATEVKLTVGLDEESKKLLNAAVKAAAKISAAAATGGKPGKGKPAAEADDDFDTNGETDGDDGDDGDGDGDEDGDGDGDGDEDGETDGDEDAVTVDHVGEAMKALATAPGSSKAEAMKLLKSVGKVDKLSALKEANFQKVIDACNKATAAKKKAAKSKK